MRLKIIFILFLLLTGCEYIAVESTPQKKAVPSHSALSYHAENQFWDTLHSGSYQKIPEAERLLTAAFLENTNDVGGALHFPEIRCVNEYAFIARSYSLFEMLPRFEVEPIEIDEIRNDSDFALDVKMTQCFRFQVFGHSGYAIRLVDGERNHRTIAGIFAYQRNVGAVQRRDHGYVDVIRCQDLLSHECRRSMGYGIVHVQHI